VATLSRENGGRSGDLFLAQPKKKPKKKEEEAADRPQKSENPSMLKIRKVPGKSEN